MPQKATYPTVRLAEPCIQLLGLPREVKIWDAFRPFTKSLQSARPICWQHSST